MNYLQMYPGLNDFADVLESVPLAIISDLTRLKEAVAKEGDLGANLSAQVSKYFSTHDTQSLDGLETLLDKLIPTLVEKMQVAAKASECLQREMDRLNTDYKLICDNEIPELVQKDPNDAAFLEIVPIEKQASARAQARREARESREARRQAQQESRSGSRTGTPAQSGTDAPKRRGRGAAADKRAADRRTTRGEHTNANHGADLESDYDRDSRKRAPRAKPQPAASKTELLMKPEHTNTEAANSPIHPVVQPIEPQHYDHIQNQPPTPQPAPPAQLEPQQPLIHTPLAQPAQLGQLGQLGQPTNANQFGQPPNLREPVHLPHQNPPVQPEYTTQLSPLRPVVQPVQPGTQTANSAQNEAGTGDQIGISAFNQHEQYTPAPLNQPDVKNETEPVHVNLGPGAPGIPGAVLPPVVMPVARALLPESGPGLDQQGVKRKHSAMLGSEPTYCYCERASFGEMVGCDGPNCEREWFHLGCIGLTALPKGQWFCTECRAKLRRK